MSYTVTFQTSSKYKNIPYGSWGGTIYSSSCGCAAFINAYRALTGKSIDLQTLCKKAEKCGARVDGGTLEAVLLRNIADEYGITWRSTSKNAELLAHLKSGGVAILHGGSSYKLFSNSGHFVAAVAASGQTITVLDSYWYSGKYTQSAIRRNYVSVLQKGVIHTSLTQCGKATIDRAPSYYLISKNMERNTDDMTEAEVRKIIDKIATEKANKAVSSWAKEAFAAATQAGVLDGTAPQGNLTREQFAVVLARLGLVSVDANPSNWAAAAWQAARDVGALDGTSPHEYVTREMLAQVLYKIGILNATDKDPQAG